MSEKAANKRTLTARERARRFYAMRKACGVCVTCGGTRAVGLKCEPCAIKRLSDTKARYEERKRNAQCGYCGKDGSTQSVVCDGCLESLREKSKRNAARNYATRKKYLEENTQARIAAKLRSRFSNALKLHVKGMRHASSVRDLGCSLSELVTHLESKFADGMNWQNYGDWHIDHVRPLASFDLQNAEEQRAACHFSNLQPLWARDNIAKGAKLAA